MVDERLQPVTIAGVEHPERGVLGIDEPARDLDDPQEHAVQGDVGRHGDHCVQQELEPHSLVDGALHARLDLVDQLLEPRFAQESTTVDVRHLPGPGCLTEKIAAWVRLLSPSLANRDET